MIMNKMSRGDSSGCSLSHKAPAKDRTITQYLKTRQGLDVMTLNQSDMNHLATQHAAHTTPDPKNIKNTSRQVMPAIHSIMVNHLSKVLRGQSLDSTGSGLASSMNRHGSIRVKPPYKVNSQPLKNAVNVFVAWAFKRAPSQSNCPFNQFINLILRHGTPLGY